MKLPVKPANLLSDGKMQPLPRCYNIITGVIFASVMMVFMSGCSTPMLDRARTAYYKGDPDEALVCLENADVPERDRILFLMERGTIYQAAGKFQESAHDYNEAYDLLAKMDTLSVSRGASSLVVSDNMLNFYGYPFERSYLHVLSAITYMAQADWQGAGVEGRRIINSLKSDKIKDYPEDAFSRYMAGLCMELVDDPSNARVEYRKASKLSLSLDISDTGQISLKKGKDTKLVAGLANGTASNDVGDHELVCIILMGRIADYSVGLPLSRGFTPPVVGLNYNDKALGYAYNMVDLSYLAVKSEQQVILKAGVKTTGRIIGKQIVADAISEQNELLGFITWMALFMLEQPDFRHWETLPRYINVGRVSCPDGLDNIELSINGGGKKSIRLSTPVRQNGVLFLAFDRVF